MDPLYIYAIMNRQPRRIEHEAMHRADITARRGSARRRRRILVG